MFVPPLLCGKKMSGKRSIFITDAALVPLFAAVLATGVRLHVAGETQSHDVWHVWAVWHTLAGIAFLALVFLHLRHHWGWYKGWRKRSVRRNGVTWLLSLSFAVTVLTGALLLACVEGVLDGMVSLCSRTGCRYMRNPAYGSAVAGTAERARAETLSGTSEACLSALPSETKKPLFSAAFSLLVPRTRLELTRRKPALPPQSSVSTNSTTWASAFAERSGSNHAYEPVSPKGCANIDIFL